MEHRNDKLILMWQCGAIIQRKINIAGEWEDVPNNQPDWAIGTEFRAKPNKELDMMFNNRGNL